MMFPNRQNMAILCFVAVLLGSTAVEARAQEPTSRATKASATAEESYIAAITVQERGKFEYAITLYTEAIVNRPRYYDAWLNRAFCYYQLKQYDKALAGYRQLIEWRPTFPEYYAHRAQCYMAKGEYDKAIADMEKVQAIAAQSPTATRLINYGLLGSAYLAAGKPDEAISHLLKAPQADPMAMATLGQSYEAKGDYASAIAQYTRYIVARPHDLEIVRKRAAAYYNLKKYAMCIADCDTCLARDPRDAVSRQLRDQASAALLNGGTGQNE